MNDKEQLKKMINQAPWLGLGIGLFGLIFLVVDKTIGITIVAFGMIYFLFLFIHMAYFSNFTPRKCIFYGMSGMIWMFLTSAIAPSMIGLRWLFPDTTYHALLTIPATISIIAIFFSLRISHPRFNKQTIVSINIDQCTWRPISLNKNNNMPWWCPLLMACLPPSVGIYLRRNDHSGEHGMMLIAACGLFFSFIIPYLSVQAILPTIEALRAELRLGCSLTRHDYQIIQKLRHKHWLVSRISR